MTTQFDADRQAERQRIIDLMRKLSKMTTANGCSEAEAVFASAKLDALRLEWDVQQDEMTIKADAAGCITDFYTSFGRREPWFTVIGSIAKLTNTKAWLAPGSMEVLGIESPTTDIKYFGYPLDVASAIALTSICFTAISTEALSYGSKMRRGNKKLMALASFKYGMGTRICYRLYDMALARTQWSNSTQLISLKDQLVTDEFAKLNLNLGKPKSVAPLAVNSAAMNAGDAAGRRVNLDPSRSVGDNGMKSNNSTRIGRN